MGLRFRSSKSVASDRLSRLSVFVMALGIAALLAAGVLFFLSATGIVGEGGLRSGPGTVRASATTPLAHDAGAFGGAPKLSADDTNRHPEREG